MTFTAETKIDGRRQCSFDRPPISNTAVNKFWVDSKSLSPRFDTHRYAVASVKSISGSVSRLFGLCAPAHIPWFVVTVIIDSIERMSGWTWPNVGPKYGVVVPAITDANSTASIPMIVSTVGIIAALSHCFPNYIFLLFMSFARSTVSVDVHTSAAFSVASVKLRTAHQRFISTLTAASPNDRTAGTFSSRFKRCQSVKFMPSQITHVGLDKCTAVA